MKKLFVMLMSLTVLALPAAAEKQWISPAQQKVNKKVAAIMSQENQKIKEMHADVLANLNSFRAAMEKRTQYNGSYIIQDMMGLMDSYIALANVSESVAVSLNNEINQPIKAGWGKTVTVAQLVRDNGHYVTPGTSTADDLDRFEALLSKKNAGAVDSHVAKTIAAAGKYADKAGLKKEAAKTFAAYFAANPNGQVQEAAYAPLADLLIAAQELNALIARTPNVDDKENYAMQFFFSQDIAGKYAALKAVNPQLAAATNELMRSFIGTVSNGTFYGGKDHPDMKTLRAFKADIGYRY